MQGQILDFSIQQNTGVISGNDQKRYHFKGSEWKETMTPVRGLRVDFDVDSEGMAVGVYKAIGASNTVTFHPSVNTDKPESEYNFIDWALKAFKHYVTFEGRARRKEYWFFMLFNMLGFVCAMILDVIFETEMLFYLLYMLMIFLPVLSVSVRRLHDIGKSGWWYWISAIPIIGLILLLIWFAQEGDQHANQYGQPSK